jgi:hypothetical protein
MEDVEFSDLVGKTLVSVVVDDGREIHFEADDGVAYKLFHQPDCCEVVVVEDICGDLGDLIGSPILMADESSSRERPEEVEVPHYEPESCTWTFYRLLTMKGPVTIRWCGTSNGYYSEKVSFEQIR